MTNEIDTFFKCIKKGRNSFDDLINGLKKDCSEIDLILLELKQLKKIDRFHQCQDKQGRNIIETEKGCKKVIYTIDTQKDYDFTINDLEKL